MSSILIPTFGKNVSKYFNISLHALQKVSNVSNFRIQNLINTESSTQVYKMSLERAGIVSKLSK